MPKYNTTEEFEKVLHDCREIYEKAARLWHCMACNAS